MTNKSRTSIAVSHCYLDEPHISRPLYKLSTSPPRIVTNSPAKPSAVANVDETETTPARDSRLVTKDSASATAPVKSASTGVKTDDKSTPSAEVALLIDPMSVSSVVTTVLKVPSTSTVAVSTRGMRLSTVEPSVLSVERTVGRMEVIVPVRSPTRPETVDVRVEVRPERSSWRLGMVMDGRVTGTASSREVTRDVTGSRVASTPETGRGFSRIGL
jgi:hypothetical protein